MSSPRRRAVHTATLLRRAIPGAPLALDARLAERAEHDPSQSDWPFTAFLEEWAACSVDRSLVPRGGVSSDAAAARMQDFLSDWEGRRCVDLLVAVSHGGIILDFLRTALGEPLVDRALPGVRATGTVAEASVTRLSVEPGATRVLRFREP